MAELEKMRAAGLLVYKILEHVEEHGGRRRFDLRSGSGGREDDGGSGREVGLQGLFDAGGGNASFPFVLCTSVNDEIVHGMPSQKRILKSGDIVSIDTGVQLNGYYGDSAITVAGGRDFGGSAAA